MFSSLPSASKIYQNSVKPRQKSASSAQKRRKKVHSVSNQHASILDDSVVSLISCGKESPISDNNDLKDVSDGSFKHSYERENSSPEMTFYPVETYEMNSKNYNLFPQQDNYANTFGEINEKCSGTLCSEENCVVAEKLNENEQNYLFESKVEENSEKSDQALVDEKFQEAEVVPVPLGTVLADSDQQNLSCDKDCNEYMNYDLISEKVISEMTFEEVEALTEYESSKELLDKAVQMNETADENIHPRNLGSDVSLQSLESQYCRNENNPDILNVDSVSTVCIAYEEGSDSCISQVENAIQSPHFEILHMENSNDTNDLTFVKPEENTVSATVINSKPHDIVLADLNGNCLSVNMDNLKNIANWANSDTCHSNDQTEDSIMKENSGPVKGHKEFSVRVESPEQSELSCTESVLCETKDYHQEILALEMPKDFNLKSSSNISQSSPNLLNEDSQTVVSNFGSSVPEGIHLSKKFVDKHSQSIVLTVFDKATLTTDLEYEKCLSERNSSNEESQNESCECQLSENSVSGSEDKASVWNVLPPLAMLKARSRSYVFGSKGPTGSLLGSDELNRFFPDNQITVFVGTWNMNGHDPPKSIDDFLLPLTINSLPDIYAIGVQESMQSRLEWEVLLQATLGPSHVLFTSTSLGVLHLCIFLRRDIIWFCSEPEEATVATRPGTMVKTKGAVAVCFMCFGTSFLFVNSHLTAHEQKLKERFSDYEKIISSLELPKFIPVKNHSRDKDVTSRFDCVFWCGDLNFRVMHDRPSVLSFVEEKVRSARPSCSFLVKHDQLHKAMEEGCAFRGFKESVIHFIPSYKFDVGTSTFNSSKLRVPSYTDRILHRSKEKSSVVCLHYNAVPDISTSDHKPVYAVFKVTLKPGRDNVPLAAGMFKREIYLEAIKRRSKFLEVRHNLGQSTICSIM